MRLTRKLMRFEWFKKLWVKKPDLEEICFKLVMNTAGLEIPKGHYIDLAPCYPGQCGGFRLTGNSNPVFEYLMFEKKLMEFILIRVEVSRKPPRIHYIATIESKHTADPVNHGKEVELKDVYRAPFEKLAGHLCDYFPYTANRFNDARRLDRAAN